MCHHISTGLYIPQSCRKEKNNVYQPHSNNIHQLHNKSLLDASKEIGIEVNADETKYMAMSQDWNSEQIHNIKVDNKHLKGWNSSDIWEQF
jgi:hypothetical protein